MVGKERFADACRAAFLFDVCFVLVTEVTQGGQNRVRSCLAETAGRILFHVVAELFQLIQIFHGSGALGDLGEDLQHTFGADAAWSTFTAGFFYSEFQEEFCDIYHTVGFIHNDQTAGTHHGADGDEVVVIDRDIKVLCRDTSAGRAAGLCCFELLAIRDAAADLFDDLAQSGTHWDLYEAGVVDLAAQRKYLGSFGLLSAHGSKPFRTV